MYEKTRLIFIGFVEKDTSVRDADYRISIKIIEFLIMKISCKLLKKVSAMFFQGETFESFSFRQISQN